MNIEQARFNMIEQQIRPWEVLNQDVLDLLVLVKRENFVPALYKNLAFVDVEVPLSDSANMLAPKFEARILQELAVKKHENVLEIGTGSGYMAALLGYKARHVTTVEIDPELKRFAEQNLSQNDIANVSVVLGDGAQGWDGEGGMGAPYDVIVISASLPVLPDAFLRQIKIGGRIAVVLGEAPAMAAKLITRRSETAYDTVTLFETNVQPLREAVAASSFKF